MQVHVYAIVALFCLFLLHFAQTKRRQPWHGCKITECMQNREPQLQTIQGFARLRYGSDSLQSPNLLTQKATLLIYHHCLQKAISANPPRIYTQSLRYMDSSSVSEYLINDDCWISSYRKQLAQQRGKPFSVNLISLSALTSCRNSWLSPENFPQVLSPQRDTLKPSARFIVKNVFRHTKDSLRVKLRLRSVIKTRE